MSSIIKRVLVTGDLVRYVGYLNSGQPEHLGIVIERSSYGPHTGSSVRVYWFDRGDITFSTETFLKLVSPGV